MVKIVRLALLVATHIPVLFVVAVASLLLATPAAVLAQPGATYRVVSQGNQGGRAEFWRNGVRYYRATGGSGGGRGFNGSLVGGVTGIPVEMTHYDTWISRETGVDMGRLVDYLINQVPDGSLVLIAVCDDAGLTQWAPFACQRLPYQWIDQLYEQLEALGSTRIRAYCYWYGWAFAAIKGRGMLGEQLSSGPGEEVSIEAVVPVEPTTWGRIKSVYSPN